MKLTYNNLQNWKAQSSSWQFYNNLSENKKNQIVCSGKYKYPFVNIVWYEINREFKNRFKELNIYKHIELFSGKEISTEDCWDTPSIYIHTCITSCLSWRIKFEVNGIKSKNQLTFSIKPPGNMELTYNNIKEFVFKWVHKKLFYPGYFGQLQQCYLIDKTLLIDLLKRIKAKNSDNIDSEQEEDMINYFLHKFHIYPDYIGINWNEFYKFVRNYINKYGKPKIPTRVLEFRMPNLLDNFDGDVDEIEQLFWDEIDDLPKDAIYI